MGGGMFAVAEKKHASKADMWHSLETMIKRAPIPKEKKDELLELISYYRQKERTVTMECADGVCRVMGVEQGARKKVFGRVLTIITDNVCDAEEIIRKLQLEGFIELGKFRQIQRLLQKEIEKAVSKIVADRMEFATKFISYFGVGAVQSLVQFQISVLKQLMEVTGPAEKMLQEIIENINKRRRVEKEKKGRDDFPQQEAV